MVVQRRKFNGPKPDYGPRAFSGYAGYRYSGITERNKPRLAKLFGLRINPRGSLLNEWTTTEGPTVKNEPVPAYKSVLPAKEQATLEKATTALLRPYNVNKWEGEAAAIAGLRVGFIERGFDWETAHLEAFTIVRKAYISLGRGVESRPTWDQARAGAAFLGERCLYCFGEIDTVYAQRGWYFCSSDCADKAKTGMDWEFGNVQKSKIGRQATKIAQLKNLPPRQCGECGGMFQPDSFEVKYCSEACREPHMGKERVLPDLHCPNCNTLFRPRIAEQKYCSQKCAAEHRSYVQPRPCLECGTVFKPHGDDQKFCTKECATTWQTRRKPELGTRHCAECGNEFYPRNNQAIYCSPRCNHNAKEARKKAARQAAAAARPWKPCECCGNLFQPKRDSPAYSRFCSPDCQKESSRQRARARAGP